MTLFSALGVIMIKPSENKADFYISAALYDTNQESFLLTTEALKANPDYAPAWELLSQKFITAGKFAEAKNAEKVAILLGSENAASAATQFMMPEKNLALSTQLKPLEVIR